MVANWMINSVICGYAITTINKKSMTMNRLVRMLASSKILSIDRILLLDADDIVYRPAGLLNLLCQSFLFLLKVSRAYLYTVIISQHWLPADCHKPRCSFLFVWWRAKKGPSTDCHLVYLPSLNGLLARLHYCIDQYVMITVCNQSSLWNLLHHWTLWH